MADDEDWNIDDLAGLLLDGQPPEIIALIYDTAPFTDDEQAATVRRYGRGVNNWPILGQLRWVRLFS